jgi:L-lysine epsilon oxidase-like protein
MALADTLNAIRWWNSSTFLDQWVANDFEEDLAIAPVIPFPRQLDETSLKQAVGGGFFPGIEAGIRLTYPAIWSARFPFRLIRSGESYTHAIAAPGVNETLTRILAPGHLTERMAVPWQADFIACKKQGARYWWPSQRPINTSSDPSASGASTSNEWYGGTTLDWYRGEEWNKRPVLKPVAAPSGEIVHVSQPPD